jgi:hypothetical protein
VYFRSTGLRPAPDIEQQFRALAANPNTLAVAARLVNDESRILKATCEAVANEELHRRPEGRRSPKSAAHGAHYHDSFVIVTAKEQGYANVRAVVGNSHPAAHIIEKGAAPHEIRASNAKALKFPFNGGARGGVGSKGGFAVNWGDGETMNRARVSHPGTTAHQIMARATRRYRRTVSRGYVRS